MYRFFFFNIYNRFIKLFVDRKLIVFIVFKVFQETFEREKAILKIKGKCCCRGKIFFGGWRSKIFIDRREIASKIKERKRETREKTRDLLLGRYSTEIREFFKP